MSAAPGFVLDCVKEFGSDDLVASSVLQEKMSYFETSFGVWAYKSVWGMDLTLGGPLCAKSDRPAMIERFLAFSKRPSLMYLRKDMIQDLEGTGLHCTGMGVDRDVDLDAFLKAPAKPVRGALKKARKAKLVIEELDLKSVSKELEERIAEITKKYLAVAECRIEMSFINRPMSLRHDGLRRVFTLSKTDREHEGAVFGYAVLNPIFKDGEIRSYLLDILRFEPTRLWGLWFSVVHFFAELMKAEGKDFHLGHCPLYKIEKAPINSSPWLDKQMNWMVQYLSSTQYLQRLRSMKSQIPGREEQRYIASSSRSALKIFLALMEVSGVSFTYLFGPDLPKVLWQGLKDRLGATKNGN